MGNTMRRTMAGLAAAAALLGGSAFAASSASASTSASAGPSASAATALPPRDFVGIGRGTTRGQAVQRAFPAALARAHAAGYSDCDISDETGPFNPIAGDTELWQDNVTLHCIG